MPHRRIRTTATELNPYFERIRTEFDLPVEFSSAVQSDAANASFQPGPTERRDLRDVEFVSIDPEGSRDLDQAFHLARNGSGYVFHYAIADVATWITPGSALDAESHRRGTTVYCPDQRVPLHPRSLSEDRASLLPGQDRPAVVWSIALDQHGETSDIQVERAMVRNREGLSYVGGQHTLDSGGNHPQLRLLQEIGELRLAVEEARGGSSLNLPEQSVSATDGHYEVHYEATLDVERWNAQLSLCAGMAAAKLMIDGKVGILRTLPPADSQTFDGLRKASAALRVPWPQEWSYGQWVRSLDTTTPHGIALTVAASKTLRGAAYAAFDGDVPLQPLHAAIAAPYAHVTAPLRRLVDRYGTECALAISHNERPPSWVLDALGGLETTMAECVSRANNVDRACVDLVEAAVLSEHIGESFDAVVTSTRERDGMIQLQDQAVVTSVRLPKECRAGDRVRVRVDGVDLDRRRVELAATTQTP